MDKPDFENRAVSAFHELKYYFDEEFEQGHTVKRLSVGTKLLVKGAMFAGAGIIGALGTGSQKFTDAEVLSAVKRLRNHCDFAALRLEPTAAVIAMFVLC